MTCKKLIITDTMSLNNLNKSGKELIQYFDILVTTVILKEK